MTPKAASANTQPKSNLKLTLLCLVFYWRKNGLVKLSCGLICLTVHSIFYSLYAEFDHLFDCLEAINHVVFFMGNMFNVQFCTLRNLRSYSDFICLYIVWIISEVYYEFGLLISIIV